MPLNLARAILTFTGSPIELLPNQLYSDTHNVKEIGLDGGTDIPDETHPASDL